MYNKLGGYMKKLIIYDINKIVLSELKRDYYKNVKNIKSVDSLYQYATNGKKTAYYAAGKVLVWKNGMYTINMCHRSDYKIG